MTTGKTIALTRRTLVGKVMYLLFNMLFRLVITFLPRSKHLLGFVVVQSLSHVWFFMTPWTTVCQTFLSFTNSQSLLKLMFIKSVMLSNNFIFCQPLLFLPSIFPSIKVFSSESALHIRWPKYCSFSFSISPSNEYSGLISFRID